MSSRRKRSRAHHQPEAVVLDFVNPEFFATFFFSALRFLVAVSSDPQRLQLRVEGAFQQTLETALILASANPIFLFHRLTPISGLLRNTLRDDHPRREERPHGPVGTGEKRSRAGHCRGGAGYQN